MLNKVNLPRYYMYNFRWNEPKICSFWEVQGLMLASSLSLQVPQCHICTKFETEDNELFAYSAFARGQDYKFIYRCANGHGYDSGMRLMDVKTGLERVVR